MCLEAQAGVLTFEGREVEVGLAVGAVDPISSCWKRGRRRVRLVAVSVVGYGEFPSGKTVGTFKPVSGVGGRR